MKEKLERMREALNKLDDKDLQLIEDAGTFYDSAIEQITKHLEWMVERKNDN